jgi:hypothetical protein
MESGEMLTTVLLMALLGGLGQLVRVGIGLKREYDRPDAHTREWFKPGQLFLSLSFGAAAGVLWWVANGGEQESVSRTYLFSVLTSGYAGSDFVEGLFTQSAPK